MEYFKILFLYILTTETGKTIVKYKNKLDKIKLRKNKLNSLLKLKYKFSVDIDNYSRYIRDDVWETIIQRLKHKYDGNHSFEIEKRGCFLSCENFCKGGVANKEKLDLDLKPVMVEFEDKMNILQNLSDYKNTKKEIRLNHVMFFIDAITLFLVVFPDRVTTIANWLKNIYIFLVELIF